ncbi:MAG: hypothetical protein AAGI46_02550 [Planctomycetota bacterium]
MKERLQIELPDPPESAGQTLAQGATMYAAPLLYPGCLLANIMSFAGHREQDHVMSFGDYVFLAFLWVGTLYPLVLLLCYLLAAPLGRRYGDRTKTIVQTWVPFYYLLTLPVLVIIVGWTQI